MNLTTIEYKEKKEEMINNKYDLGFFNNFTQIFGKNPFAWVLPIQNDIELGGYAFETNINYEQERKNFKYKQIQKKENLYNSKDTIKSDFVIRDGNKGESLFNSQAELNNKTYNI